MSIDREAALKKAEKLLRQGRLDGAIEEYVRLIEDQPRDWNAINALGDLYVRAGDGERAVAQFTRVGDYLFGEGFLQKAAALYKKALKVESEHDHTLSRLAEIAARQGLLAGAKTYLRQLEQVRRRRGDELGAAECVERFRALEDTDAEPAPPAPAPEPPPPAAPPNAAGAERERESGGDDPDRLFILAQRELASGSEPHARAILIRVLTLDPDRHDDVTQIALDLARGGRLESALGCIDVVTDTALLGGDWNRAVTALQMFVRVAPHIPAIIKLVELCVDAGLDAPLREAQAQLADAYLEAGKGSEARVISEDLLENEPERDDHAQRLRRALDLLGVADADRSIADVLARRSAASAGPEMSADAAPGESAAQETVEIDLSDILANIGAPLAAAAAGTDPYDRALAHLEGGRVADAIADLEAAAAFPRTGARAAAELGRLYVRRGDLEAGVEWLERAADGPAATPDEGFAVLYELADALERLGEPGRALAVLIDLDADAGDYRDVRTRIDHLARAQAGSHGR